MPFFNFTFLLFNMKYLLIVITIFSLTNQLLYAQDSFNNSQELDSLYREDQIYFGVTYNILNNKLRSMSQNGFSGGFHLGIIRDFPINNKRNVALGVGLGLSSSSFNQNLKISKTNEQYIYEVLNGGNFDKNKFNLYQIELPFEFRWRTSTAETYKFWRIYAGFKLGYIFSSKTKFVSTDESYRININDAINKFQYGLTFSAGYDSWNLHLYYTLNTIFEENKVNDEPLDLSVIKVGLMFYIL